MSALDRRTDAAITETRRGGPVRRGFGVLGWTLLLLVLLILATVAGALGVLQTGWGRREIASLVSGALSGQGKTAEIAGIEGFLPFEIRVDRVRLGDPQGHWLESMAPASTSALGAPAPEGGDRHGGRELEDFDPSGEIRRPMDSGVAREERRAKDFS